MKSTKPTKPTPPALPPLGPPSYRGPSGEVTPEALALGARLGEIRKGMGR